MEALVAVGLASNVLQFVDFTTKLIGISNELRNHAASSENRDHRVIATHLVTLSQNISDSVKAISQNSGNASSEEKDLQQVADKCCELANDLLKRLDACGIKPGTLKTIWNKREIGEISSRLENFRSELILYYAFQNGKTQADQQQRQSSKDDIQAILDRLDDLGPVIERVKHGIIDKSNVQHSELLNSIAEARSENAQFHAQASKQVLADQSAVLGKLDGLEASMTTLNVGIQDMQRQHSSTIEPLAQATVENSTFLASIVQHVSLSSGSGSSLRHALRPLLEEYKETFIAEVKKEFRVAARSEMENMLQKAFPALDEMQSRGEATQREHTAVVDEVSSETGPGDFDSQSSFEPQDPEIIRKQNPDQSDKNRLTIIYRKSWFLKTSIGILSLNIRDRIYFDAFGSPTEVYELAAQFTPSPRWFSTGRLLIYENRSDARGSPEFGLRLRSHRVLDKNHEVWGVIRSGHISRLCDMLSQKIISTSDTNAFGRTLLYESRQDNIDQFLRDWIPLCRLVDFDFHIPDGFTFLEVVIKDQTIYETWFYNEPAISYIQFDAIAQLKIEGSSLADPSGRHMAFATMSLYYELRLANDRSGISKEASPTLSTSYRDYYVNTQVANRLLFLEYVISKQINERPDSIFSTYYGDSTSYKFYHSRWRSIWEGILEDHGFDVGWVYREDDRRRRVGVGETTAHEVDVVVDTSQALEVKRRRGYENSDD
ncbi:uncharacterized protein GGS22DRAFT_181907 [Annulohypoxylon maeteangense]|uniref:uncharacterized protein n=1 Tax=Annulohypoxylon maeteangense TaxID=1927788 RepID=UPI002007A959|nr:uncharacterized protein GGS22DRAFT_181907 [Annulohypoxylon maeteangense]KAI0881092.1 hypothetical protein GGS22DRAFT_181907 [Annulohypoxylon maeteangense]